MHQILVHFLGGQFYHKTGPEMRFLAKMSAADLSNANFLCCKGTPTERRKYSKKTKGFIAMEILGVVVPHLLVVRKLSL